MNKAELIHAIATETKLSKSDCKKMLEEFMKSVTKALQAGEKVTLTGFGTFSILQKKERIGINPSTKKEIIIPAKRSVKFKLSNELAEAVK